MIPYYIDVATNAFECKRGRNHAIVKQKHDYSMIPRYNYKVN